MSKQSAFAAAARAHKPSITSVGRSASNPRSVTGVNVSATSSAARGKAGAGGAGGALDATVFASSYSSSYNGDYSNS